MTTENQGTEASVETTGSENVATEESQDKSLADSLYSKESEGEDASSPEPKSEVGQEPNEEKGEDKQPEDTEGEKKAEGEIDYSALKLPEKDSFVGEKDLERIAAFAKEQGLSLDTAQKILDDNNERLSEYRGELEKQVLEKSEQDYQELLKDPVLGGKNIDETRRLALLALDKFSPPGSGLKELLISSKVENNPIIVAFLRNIATQFDNDKTITGNMHTPPKEKTFAQRMYPSN